MRYCSVGDSVVVCFSMQLQKGRIGLDGKTTSAEGKSVNCPQITFSFLYDKGLVEFLIFVCYLGLSDWISAKLTMASPVSGLIFARVMTSSLNPATASSSSSSLSGI